MTTSTPTKAKTSSVSLWKNFKKDSKLRLFGDIQVTPKLLREALEQEPDEYGRVSLRVSLFKNESDNKKAPMLTGRVELKNEVDEF